MDKNHKGELVKMWYNDLVELKDCLEYKETGSKIYPSFTIVNMELYDKIMKQLIYF